MGFDEGVEEGCSSLEPLSQDECGSECSASCSKHLRNHPEPLSLTVGNSFTSVVPWNLINPVECQCSMCLVK